MTAPYWEVTVGNVETTATIVTPSVAPPPIVADTVSPTLALLAFRNAWVAMPGIEPAATDVGAARSSSPWTGPPGALNRPNTPNAPVVPQPVSNVVVHAEPAPTRDERTEGRRTTATCSPRSEEH